MESLAQLKLGFSPIHKMGLRFVVIAAAIALLLMWLHFFVLGSFALLVTGYLAIVLRDPTRSVPAANGDVVSPCDGYVTKIEKIQAPVEIGAGEETVWRITILPGIFDPLVIRTLTAGRITKILDHPGQGFPSVFGSPAGERESVFIVLNVQTSGRVAMKVTAGWLPNLITKLVQEDETLLPGQRVALVSPLSQMDVYLPSQALVQVGIGQRMIAGETVLWRNDEGPHAPRFARS